MDGEWSLALSTYCGAEMQHNVQPLSPGFLKVLLIAPDNALLVFCMQKRERISYLCKRISVANNEKKQTKKHHNGQDIDFSLWNMNQKTHGIISDYIVCVLFILLYISYGTKVALTVCIIFFT